MGGGESNSYRNTIIFCHQFRGILFQIESLISRLPPKITKMADRRSVRAELERKRIQLAQMRQERERRSRMHQEDENIPAQNLDSREKLEDADAVLKALGLSASLSRVSTAPSTLVMDQSRSSEIVGSSSPSLENTLVSPALHQQQKQPQQLSTSLNDSYVMQSSLPKAAVPLQIVHVNQVNIPPKERLYYTKSTQTSTSPGLGPALDNQIADKLVNATAAGLSPSDVPQQKSYYGKQTKSNSMITSDHDDQSNSRSNLTPTRIAGNSNISHNTQATGANNTQLALEWDDEFMSQHLQGPLTNTSVPLKSSFQLAQPAVLTYPDDEDEQSSDFNHIPTGRQSLSQVEMIKPTVDGKNGRKDSSVGTTEIRELNDDERKQIEIREDYQQFIERATKVLERALCYNESPEVFIQYFPDGGKDAIDDDRRSGSKLSLTRIFSDEKWSRNRCVTSFDWSAQYPELLLASYFVNEQAPSDPDGVLLVWNMKFKNTSPEYTFHCQSPIMSCCFAKFHPSLIVGGTYSGQIVLWDMRSNKKTPVQRSPLTAAAHTHPVYCAKVVGTQNAHNLISVSTDGKLCSWSLDMLSAPQETMELNQQKQTRSVAVTCMSFHPDDYNNFLVGSEEGAIYSACRHGSRTGILNNFESHQGLVTNVDFRPVDTQPGYSHLFLSSSIDWTVKLWDSKEVEPIHSFESNSDYVYDVKWSPNNPFLFATADGDGRVDIWNFAQDSELPIASTHVEPITNADSSKAHPSLNKLIWTPSGNQVVVGDDVGRIHVYDIGDVGDLGRRQEEKWKLRDHISTSQI